MSEPISPYTNRIIHKLISEVKEIDKKIKYDSVETTLKSYQSLCDINKTPCTTCITIKI